MSVTIEIEHDGWQKLDGLNSLAQRAGSAALAARQAKGDVFLLFTSDAEIRQLNRAWRGKDAATNVLSFPVAAGFNLPEGEVAPLGDVVLAHETIVREAEAQGKSASHHTAHLIVHGVLHLLGYDHRTDAEAAVMENEERRILAGLGISDPYAP